VEEPAFLVPVQRIVGRIEIERDLLGSSAMNSPSIAAVSAANLL